RSASQAHLGSENKPRVHSVRKQFLLLESGFVIGKRAETRHPGPARGRRAISRGRGYGVDQAARKSPALLFRETESLLLCGARRSPIGPDSAGEGTFGSLLMLNPPRHRR